MMCMAEADVFASYCMFPPVAAGRWINDMQQLEVLQ